MLVRADIGSETIEAGLSVDDPRLGFTRPTFSVFAFGGVGEPETIAAWLKNAKTISLVCCLEAGCVLRIHDPAHVSGAEGALTRFAECLRGGIGLYATLFDAMKPNFGGYAEVESLPYWDAEGYDWPASYKPTEEQIRGRERLYAARPSVRRRPKDPKNE